MSEYEEHMEEISSLKTIEITRLKNLEEFHLGVISDLEEGHFNKPVGTISKAEHDKVLSCLELEKLKYEELLNENNILVMKNKEILGELETYKNSVKEVVNVPLEQGNESLIYQFENEIETLKDEKCVLQEELDLVTAERNELKDINGDLKNQVCDLKERLNDQEFEIAGLKNRIAECDVYISEQERERLKGSEKSQMASQGCNMFTELIEGGKKAEADLVEVYGLLRDEKEKSRKYQACALAYQDEVNKLQEELMKFRSRKEIIFTEDNKYKIESLEKKVRYLEDEITDKVNVISDLLSKDTSDNIKYRMENQRLRTDNMNRIKDYQIKVRNLSEELDRSKYIIVHLKNLVRDLNSLAYKSESYKDMFDAKRLNEIKVNFDVSLEDMPKENDICKKRKFGGTAAILERAKQICLDNRKDDSNTSDSH
uniref:DUF4201 domain-containing protein n=1 Tax=Parastrongyloides trichosuri TaxID=131310 RepID=A0A0N4ZCY8_PARTI